MKSNTKTSAFSAVIDRLPELSESELRQLHAVVGIRLGFTEANAVATTKVAAPAKKPQPKAAASSKKKPTGGNPQRKSQWANHPLYQEYSRLKSVVESQSKEQKCSFNAVDTADSRAYKQAFIRWMEAKSRFRDHKATESSAAPAEGAPEGAPETQEGQSLPATD